jgi:hypothetical protein
VTDNNVRLGIRYVDLGQNQMECGNYSGSSSDNLSTLYYGGDTHKNRHILYYSIYYTALCYMCRNERRRLQRFVRPRVWPSCFYKIIRIFHISKVNTGHKLLWKHEPFVYLQRISEKYLLIRIIFYIIYIIYIYYLLPMYMNHIIFVRLIYYKTKNGHFNRTPFFTKKDNKINESTHPIPI